MYINNLTISDIKLNRNTFKPYKTIIFDIDLEKFRDDQVLDKNKVILEFLKEIKDKILISC
jgi:hypothetical protein